MLTDAPGRPESCCFLPAFFLALPGTAPSLRPPPAALLRSPLRFAPGPSERRAKGPLPNPGGDSVRFTQFLPLPLFSIARLPFPTTPVRNGLCPPFPTSLFKMGSKLSGQHPDRCFSISRRGDIHQRTPSPSYQLERDRQPRPSAFGTTPWAAALQPLQPL